MSRMSEIHADRETVRALTEPEQPRNPLSIRDGEIWWDGVWKSREAATLLRDEFARKLPAGDWFASTAQRFAAGLTEALRLTEKEHA